MSCMIKVTGNGKPRPARKDKDFLCCAFDDRETECDTELGKRWEHKDGGRHDEDSGWFGDVGTTTALGAGRDRARRTA